MASTNFNIDNKKNEIMLNIENIESKIKDNNISLQRFTGDLEKILNNLKSILTGVKQLKSEINSTKNILSGELSGDEAEIAKYKQQIAVYESLLNEIASRINTISNTSENTHQKNKLTDTISAIRSEMNQINDLLGIKNDNYQPPNLQPPPCSTII